MDCSKLKSLKGYCSPEALKVGAARQRCYCTDKKMILYVYIILPTSTLYTVETMGVNLHRGGNLGC